MNYFFTSWLGSDLIALTQAKAAANWSKHNLDGGNLFESEFLYSVNIQHPIGDNHWFLLLPCPSDCCLATTTKLSICFGKLKRSRI